MANVTAFIQVLEQFLDELTSTFPEQTSLKKYRSTFDLLRKANPRKIMESFVASATPYVDHILKMDESFFLNSDIEFLKALDVQKWWTSDLSAATKQSIWQYLQYLVVTSGIGGMPPMPTMPDGVQDQIQQLAESIPTTNNGKNFDVDSIPPAAIMNIAKQFDPGADISEEHVKQAMDMVKNMMSSGESPDDLMGNLMKSMGGNFSK